MKNDILNHYQNQEYNKLNKRILSVTQEKFRSVSHSETRIPMVRASLTDKNPMDKVINWGLKDILEVSHINYDDLIGYIDPVGIFWMNHSHFYDDLYSRPSISQSHISQNSTFKNDSMKEWKSSMNQWFNIITNILQFEINKEKYRYKHQQNMVLKILMWNSTFELEFEEYLNQVYQVSFVLEG